MFRIWLRAAARPESRLCVAYPAADTVPTPESMVRTLFKTRDSSNTMLQTELSSDSAIHSELLKLRVIYHQSGVES